MERVDIKGFEGYQITDDGRVWSKKTNKWIKSALCKGYKHISLRKNGFTYTKFIHKLVAEAFIPNLENKPEIDHKNTDRTDNRVENLRWTDRKGNMNNPITVEKLKNRIISEETKKKMSYAKQHLSYEAKKNMSLAHIGQISARRKKVYQYTKDKQLINEYESVTDAAKKNSFDKVSIGDCCRGRLKTYKGYIWKYV